MAHRHRKNQLYNRYECTDGQRDRIPSVLRNIQQRRHYEKETSYHSSPDSLARCHENTRPDLHSYDKNRISGNRPMQSYKDRRIPRKHWETVNGDPAKPEYHRKQQQQQQQQQQQHFNHYDHPAVEVRDAFSKTAYELGESSLINSRDSYRETRHRLDRPRGPRQTRDTGVPFKKKERDYVNRNIITDKPSSIQRDRKDTQQTTCDALRTSRGVKRAWMNDRPATEPSSQKRSNLNSNVSSSRQISRGSTSRSSQSSSSDSAASSDSSSSCPSCPETNSDSHASRSPYRDERGTKEKKDKSAVKNKKEYETSHRVRKQSNKKNKPSTPEPEHKSFSGNGTLHTEYGKGTNRAPDEALAETLSNNRGATTAESDTGASDNQGRAVKASVMRFTKTEARDIAADCLVVSHRPTEIELETMTPNTRAINKQHSPKPTRECAFDKEPHTSLAQVKDNVVCVTKPNSEDVETDRSTAFDSNATTLSTAACIKKQHPPRPREGDEGDEICTSTPFEDEEVKNTVLSLLIENELNLEDMEFINRFNDPQDIPKHSSNLITASTSRLLTETNESVFPDIENVYNYIYSGEKQSTHKQTYILQNNDPGVCGGVQEPPPPNVTHPVHEPTPVTAYAPQKPQVTPPLVTSALATEPNTAPLNRPPSPEWVERTTLPLTAPLVEENKNEDVNCSLFQQQINTLLSLLQECITCASCRCIFNRSLVCTNYILRFNQPIQCACGCVLCTKCYTSHRGCKVHNLVSKHATVNTTANNLANCVYMEKVDSWDLKVDYTASFKTEADVDKYIGEIMARDDAPTRQQLAIAFERLITLGDAMSFKYWINSPLMKDTAHKYVCISHVPGFWDRVLVGKRVPDTETMLSRDTHLPRLFNVTLPKPLGFHWCCFVFSDQVILSMWCMKADVVLPLTDSKLKSLTTSKEFRTMVYCLNTWFKVQYCANEPDRIKVALDCLPSDSPTFVHMLTTIASKSGMSTVNLTVRQDRQSDNFNYTLNYRLADMMFLPVQVEGQTVDIVTEYSSYHDTFKGMPCTYTTSETFYE